MTPICDRAIFVERRGLKANGKSEIQGSLHCGGRKRRLRRDDVCYRWVKERATARSRLDLGLGETSEGEEFFVDDYEEGFGAGEYGAVGVLQFGLVEELAALAVEVAADEDERLWRGGTKVVDLMWRVMQGR